MRDYESKKQIKQNPITKFDKKGFIKDTFLVISQNLQISLLGDKKNVIDGIVKKEMTLKYGYGKINFGLDDSFNITEEKKYLDGAK